MIIHQLEHSRCHAVCDCGLSVYVVGYTTITIIQIHGMYKNAQNIYKKNMSWLPKLYASTVRAGFVSTKKQNNKKQKQNKTSSELSHD